MILFCIFYSLKGANSGAKMSIVHLMYIYSLNRLCTSSLSSLDNGLQTPQTNSNYIILDFYHMFLFITSQICMLIVNFMAKYIFHKLYILENPFSHLTINLKWW